MRPNSIPINGMLSNCDVEHTIAFMLSSLPIAVISSVVEK